MGGRRDNYIVIVGPMGQLKIFWHPLAAHRYLVGPLGQLKIFQRPLDAHRYLAGPKPKVANIQFWYLRFERTYLTEPQLTG